MMKPDEGPRGGVNSRRFDLVMPPRLHAELSWVAQRRGISMGHVLREAIVQVCREERERFLREAGAV